jgi:1-acyl-sn-glycerol-3-phosphate acyltransferase
MMFRMMKLSSNILCICSGITPKNIGRDHIDFKQSYIIIPTHKSYIEAATLYTSIPSLFKTLGKKELEKVPVYGLIFKTVCISVDRSSLTARALSFRKIKNELEQGLSVTIFPEGTFKDIPDNQLLPFQDGSFTLAIMQSRSAIW